MKTYNLEQEVILEYDCEHLITQSMFDFIFYLRDNNYGHYNGVVESSKIKKSNLNGFQSHEHNFLRFQEHIDESFNNIFNFITSAVNSDCDSRFTYKLNNYWFNINKKGSLNKLHNHSTPNNPSPGISGVFYLQVPENSGNIVFESEDKSELEIDSKTGSLLLFPMYLNHKVLESQSDLERISFAFNYDGIVKPTGKILM